MHVYFMGVCGTGMGNAALLLRELGHQVSGSDQNVYPPMSDQLRAGGIEILQGYDAERLARLKPDLVVVGNVNSRGNPEVEWLLETRAVDFVSLPEALGKLILRPRPNLVVAGTHGKTTTTAMAAVLLKAAGRDPGYLIGGVPRDLPGGSHGGAAGSPFVIEGDEYDSAFFDKRSKFIHYVPRVLALNNLEFDHADIFRDLEDIQRTFSHLIRLVPRHGGIVANGDDANLATLININFAPVFRVGTGLHNDLRIMGYEEGPEGSSFDLVWHGKVWHRVRWALGSLYNARNAAIAALGAAKVLGLEDPTRLDLAALDGYQGVQRRQEVLFDDGVTTVISDFGHHPTAIAETLDSLRLRFPGRPLAACFEARSNTAVRRVLQDDFRRAFDRADRVHLGSVFRAERYREDERIDMPGMARELGPKARSHGDNRALQAGLLESLQREPRQVVVFFSNGSFDGVIAAVAAAMKGRVDL